jgi:ring-1,2-phenylacetyl-CoA epoxidase subunit PaaE
MSSSAQQVIVVLDGTPHEIEIREEETIFRAALRHGLAPPFSCVSGYCGECVATLEQGEVEMGENRALSPKQLARGEILTCQARPRRGPCRVRFGRSSL